MILQSVLQRLPRIRRRANSHPKHGTTARDQTSITKRIKTTGDVLIPSRVMTLWPALLRGCCCGCGVETGLERWGVSAPTSRSQHKHWKAIRYNPPIRHPQDTHLYCYSSPECRRRAASRRAPSSFRRRDTHLAPRHAADSTFRPKSHPLQPVNPQRPVGLSPARIFL
jgi:hypothetical protein